MSLADSFNFYGSLTRLSTGFKADVRGVRLETFFASNRRRIGYVPMKMIPALFSTDSL